MQINGNPIIAIQSPAEENDFAADFPGQMKRFTDGKNSYFVRIVDHETRQLHPSSDCFKGLGYSIEPQPLVVGNDGSKWSCFIAAKSNRSYTIMERIYDNQGNSWTDVSEWYWSACCNKTQGPWWDVTIANNSPASDSKY